MSRWRPVMPAELVYGVCVEDWVSVALRVGGEKRSLHGHDYRVRVCLEGPIDERGMVVDHSILSRLLRECVDAIDYGVLNEALGAQSATAELLSRHVYDCISSRVEGGYRVVLVSACTPRGYCSYIRASLA